MSAHTTEHIESYLQNHLSEIKQLGNTINQYNNFLIVGHNNPDGDCIGSMLALGRWLKNAGKHCAYVVGVQEKDNFSYVPGITNIYDIDTFLAKDHVIYDCIIFVDLSHNKRIDRIIDSGYIDSISIRCCIDHHIHNRTFTTCDIIDTNSQSCCELLWELMNYLKPECIDDTIAGYCILGTMTDSGDGAGFEHEKNSIRTFENALSMLYAGANKGKRFYVDEIKKIKLPLIQFTTLLWQRLEYTSDIAWLWYKDKEYELLGLGSEEVKRGFDILKQCSEFTVYIRVVQYEGMRYISMRSKQYNVRIIAEQFGGGGHDKAAAFNLPGKDSDIENIRSCIQKIQNEIYKQKQTN